MVEGSTKQEILNCTKERTKKALKDGWGILNAQSIAEQLKISRNLASQYLNQLVHEKELLKVNSRPVCFIHIKTLEQEIDIKIQQEYFEDMDEFEEFLRCQSQSFQSLIGYNASLGECIEQIKISAHYPSKGLPILLIGEKGTGKTLLCTMIFQYLKSEAVIPKDAKYMRVIFHGNMARNEEMLRKLFSGKEGISQNEEHGVVVFERFHRLDKTLQNRVLDSVENLNCDKTSDWRFIFTSEPVQDEAVMNVWKSRIPVVAVCPGLSQRTVEEKENMVLQFFMKEENFIHKKIRVSQKVFSHLIQFDFANNIEGLQSEVKKLCAKAYLYQRSEDVLSVHSFYFSEELLASVVVDEDMEESAWIFPGEWKKNKTADENQELKQMICDIYARLVVGECSMEELLDRMYQLLQKKIKEHSHKSQMLQDVKTSSVSVILADLISITEGRFHFIMPKSFARMISDALRKQMSGIQEEEADTFRMVDLQKKLFGYMAGEGKAAEYLCGLIQNNLGIEPNPYIKTQLIVGIRYYNQQFSEKQMNAIIICHGSSTASSMADAVNSILNKRIFEALDMPLDMSVQQIAETLKKYILRKNMFNRVIVLVDMGSLELIDKELSSLPNITLGIMNQASTGLAIHVGALVLEGKDIAEILKTSSLESVPNYRIIQNEEKQKAILFIGERQTDVAEKMKTLFWESFPKQIAVKALYWDYGDDKELEDFVKETNCEILLSIGVNQSRLRKVPHMDISEVILFSSNPVIHTILRDYFTEHELQILSKNLLKNFSMQNIMQHLTILNPVTLTNRIEVSLELLQHYLNTKLKPNIIMGLYVHLSFLIERLVTKSPIDSSQNMDRFERENQDFIQIVRKSFDHVMSNYHIDISLSEIAYIYEFIIHNDDVEHEQRLDIVEDRE